MAQQQGQLKRTVHVIDLSLEDSGDEGPSVPANKRARVTSRTGQHGGSPHVPPSWTHQMPAPDASDKRASTSEQQLHAYRERIKALEAENMQLKESSRHATQRNNKAREQLSKLANELEDRKASEASLKRQLDEARRQCECECPVCLEAKPDMLLACGHLVCACCMHKLKQCPCCRTTHHPSLTRKVFWG